MQASVLDNAFQMFDLASLRNDNNRWSVRMRSTSFRTARKGPSVSVRKFGAGLLMMGLALTASAKDGSTSVEDKAPSTEAKAKVNHKPRRWFQVGVASWYGSHFQGRKTAAGEPFNMNLMTCAHPTLPMGTWLRVTNLKNRKSAFVRVNDRGPVSDGRVVDLSMAAARAVGLAGVGRVKLETVRDSDPALVQALVAQLQLPVLIDPLRVL
jgi:rare lipoprotein A